MVAPGHYRKRYRNYAIGIGIYVLINLAIFAVAGSWDDYAFIIILEDLLFPSSVVLSNFFFDRRYGQFMAVDRIRRKVLLKVTLSVVVIFGMTWLGNIAEWSSGHPDEDILTFGEGAEIGPWWTNIVTNVFLTLLLGIPAFFREGLIDKEKAELASARSEVENLSKELNILELELYSANVKPHFIFNALNGLLTLIKEHPDKAEELVLHLSSFLRSSLYSTKSNQHSLEEEFRTMEEYLSIESIRFGDNINFELDLEDGMDKIQVPKFFILPLVENSIKHNSQQERLFIGLEARMSDDYLIVSVSDDGSPFPSSVVYNAGLKGTEALLSSFYGNGFEIRFENDDVKRVEIRIEKKHVSLHHS